MLELGAAILVLAIALSFISDATSSTVKLVRATTRRGKIHVAEKH